VYAEFLIAFPPVLIFFLCLIQLSLVYVAKLSVQHASMRAARATVVVLSDDPAEYDDEPVNVLDPDGTTSGTSSILPGFTALGIVGLFGASDAGSARLQSIRSAAFVPLIPISPSMTWLGGRPSVARAFEAGPMRVATGSLYAKGATAVTFYGQPQGTDQIWRFQPRQSITTRVTHLYYCPIPVANRILCDSLLPILLTSRPARAELLYTGAPAFPAVFAIGGARFVLIRAESTLPNQGAGYEYH